jgi:hypothetical protein
MLLKLSEPATGGLYSRTRLGVMAIGSVANAGSLSIMKIIVTLCLIEDWLPFVDLTRRAEGVRHS